MRTRSIRFRLTIWYGVVLTAGMGLFGALVWLSLRHQLIGDFNRDLEGRASRFETYFRSELVHSPPGQLQDELEEFCQALPPASYIDLHGANGLAFRYPAAAPAEDARFSVLRREFVVDGEVFKLEVGAPIAELRHVLELLRYLLLSLIPVVIGIACMGGAWLSRRALKPVQDITAAALTISLENLSERLPVPNTGDEVAQLTEVLNSMLARLESAVKTLSQFAADASHELRTPLAVIRTTAELALRRERSTDAYRAGLHEVVAEAERMTRLIEDLLLLTRSDAGAVEMPKAAMDLREVLGEVCAELSSLSAARQIRVTASLGEEPTMISGNRLALHRLFLVLLDNALKYSRPGGEVILTFARTNTSVAVSIQDFGEGISEAVLPHIFKRFYQADAARSAGGHGLGLSLAESIAQAHAAQIEVHSVAGAGSTFRVVFFARDPVLAPANLTSNAAALAGH
jgi:signal transduction histidine kinase